MLQWVIPFYETTLSVATTVFPKLPKISLEGSQSKQNFFSQVHLLLQAAVHLSNYLIALLALSSVFVFPSIFFFANSFNAIPCNSWQNSAWFGFPSNSSHIAFLPSPLNSLSLPLFAPPHLFLGSVLIFASAPPKPQYLFCPPFVPLFRLSPTNRDCVTSWLEPSSLG